MSKLPEKPAIASLNDIDPAKTIMMMPYVNQWPAGDEEMVALFDIRDISQQEVEELIRTLNPDSTPYVVTMTQQQFDTVFRSIISKQGS